MDEMNKKKIEAILKDMANIQKIEDSVEENEEQMDKPKVSKKKVALGAAAGGLGLLGILGLVYFGVKNANRVIEVDNLNEDDEDTEDDGGIDLNPLAD